MDTIFDILKKISTERDIKIYIVGGYIRNCIMGDKSSDIDVVVNKDIEDVVNDFANAINGKVVSLNNDYSVYKVIDKQRGIHVDFSDMDGADIHEDLSKRDFTINSMAIDVSNDIDIKSIIDPLGGKKDLKNKVIRAVHDKTFTDDPIRMLRAVRFMAQMNFELDCKSKESIRRNKTKITTVSGERIANEFFKILKFNNTHYYFKFMDEELNIFEQIFPEVAGMKEVGRCEYHVVDVFTHSLFTLKIMEDIINDNGYFEEHLRAAYEQHSSQTISGEHRRLELIKLAAFFHDVGKPISKWEDNTGRTRFRGHEVTGAESIRDIARRWSLSIKEREILYRVVHYHMLPLVSYKANDVGGEFLYDMFTKCGNETLDVLLVALADIVSTRRLLFPEEEMGKFKVHIEYMANNYLTRYKDVEDISHIITGTDIMSEFNIDEGIKVGELIGEAKKAIYLGKVPPRKNAVIDYLKNVL